MKHVIIGAGAAGITAAKVIRENRKDDEIVIISTDDAVYSRCMLHKFIGGSRNVAELSFIPPNFFEENNIRWRSNKTVTGVNIKEKRIVFNCGKCGKQSNESYDRLLLATGSQSFFPPIEGLRPGPAVCTLRDLSDAKKIRMKADNAKNIVIIGAGLVGLDAAYGLVEMGKTPTIVEMGQHILSANLDPRAAMTYQAKFEEAGCRFIFGNRVKSIEFDDFGTSGTIVFESGDKLPTDLLIVAAGVSPAIGLLKSSGIPYNRGVIVNEYLATEAEYVYAAGDITGLSESWPSAISQGEIAALNMCGIKSVYDDILERQNTVNFFDIPSLSVGRLNPEPGDVVHIREDQQRYQKVITQNNISVGVTLQGDISRSGFWQYLIKHKIPINNAQESLWKTSFADSYELDANGEYKWAK
ncbi:MAG: FAD-dependent oxidoreductase [Defluviitaleaceae bacterium]|nr:FAD-dependent oxidoreductase [Defluviitaleaceae bacterium]